MSQNHHKSALRQMSSGISLFFEWLSQHHGDAQLGSPRFPLVLTNLSELAVQLYHVFGRIMLQTILFVDTKPQEWRFMTPIFTPAMPSITLEFTSVEDARDTLDSCLFSFFHGALVSRVQGKEYEEMPESPTNFASHPGGGCLYRWKLAFAAFMSSQNTTLSPSEQQAAIILEMLYIASFVLASVGIFDQEIIILDQFEQSFSRIVALANRFISNMGDMCLDPEPPYLVFDMGILPPLYSVASHCRHRTIRREAIRLIRNGPTEEGIWNNSMLSNVAQRIMDLEEKGLKSVLDSVDAPPGARLSVLNATINSAQRKVALECGRWPSEGQGKMQVVHESVEF